MMEFHSTAAGTLLCTSTTMLSRFSTIQSQLLKKQQFFNTTRNEEMCACPLECADCIYLDSVHFLPLNDSEAEKSWI